jgi:hypothetical protein
MSSLRRNHFSGSTVDAAPQNARWTSFEARRPEASRSPPLHGEQRMNPNPEMEYLARSRRERGETWRTIVLDEILPPPPEKSDHGPPSSVIGSFRSDDGAEESDAGAEESDAGAEESDAGSNRSIIASNRSVHASFFLDHGSKRSVIGPNRCVIGSKSSVIGETKWSPPLRKWGAARNHQVGLQEPPEESEI